MMTFRIPPTIIVMMLSLLTFALAEKHAIMFDNRCGHGTPQLVMGGKILANNASFSIDGPLLSGIAYLQTGKCLLNGEGCTLVEMSLVNPTCPGCGSSTDISLIPPLAYSIPTGFSYFGGCDGIGATCSSPSCPAAFFSPDENRAQVACQDNNVNLLITFCGDGGQPTGNSPPANTNTQLRLAPSTSLTGVAVSPTTDKTTTSAPSPTKTKNCRRKRVQFRQK